MRPFSTIMDVKVDAGFGKVLAVERDPADNDDRSRGAMMPIRGMTAESKTP